MLCCLGEQDINLGVNKSRKAGFILTNTPGAVTAGMHGGALAMRNCYYTCSNTSVYYSGGTSQYIRKDVKGVESCQEDSANKGWAHNQMTVWNLLKSVIVKPSFSETTFGGGAVS